MFEEHFKNQNGGPNGTGIAPSKALRNSAIFLARTPRGSLHVVAERSSSPIRFLIPSAEPALERGGVGRDQSRVQERARAAERDRVQHREPAGSHHHLMSLCEPDGTYWGADGRARGHRRVNRSHTSPPKRHWTARDPLPGGVSRGGLANADGRTRPARDQIRPCSADRARTSTLQCAAVRREGGAVRDDTVIARRATTGNDQAGRAAGARSTPPSKSPQY